jgi:cGMP-dependent protein kinase 1
MEKKNHPKINVIPEEKKLNAGPRKEIKKKAPVLDPRRGSRIAVEALTAVIIDRLKTSRDVELISNALNKHFIFTSLSAENRMMVISHMKLYTLGPKELVFEQGSPGSNFYVVASGKLEILVTGKRVNVLGPGDSFGELGLLHDSPRSATVQTLEKVSIWGLDRKTFRSAVETVNAQNYKENKNFIDTVPLFSVLTPVQRDSLVGSLSTLMFRPNDIIVKEGDPGDLFYIIKDGTVSCSQNGTQLREMTKGSFFGDQALLYNTVRTATITAITNVKCVAISRNKLNAALGKQLQQIIYQNSKLIGFEKSQILSRLTKKVQMKLLERMKVCSYNNGKIVISAGSRKNARLLIVLFGELRSNNSLLAEVFQSIGDGEISTDSNDLFNYDIVASGETHVAEITKEEFEDCMGEGAQVMNLSPEAISALKGIHILRSLPGEKLASLTSCLKIQDFEDKDAIIRQNTPGDSFFIIKSGKVDIVQDGITLRTVTKNDYFGERSVIFNDCRTASVIANGPVTCWYLTRDDFFRILDESVRNMLIKRIELQDDDITLKDLTAVKLLGKGMFGNVFLVVDKQKRRLYALKTVTRRKVEKYEMQENLILERKILLTLDHVFILKLVKSFKDTKRIYFLTEFVRGSDLFDVLRELSIVSERDAKFYVGCLILILEYVHERDIVYRDLKPENVMIDEEGYPKLIDFGISKILNGRTYTIVGTPHYMAPEVITGKGYSLTADYWSLGIMLYEFVCCSVPFGEDEEDPYAIYEKVLERRLIYPNFVDAKMPCKPLIEQLLSKNPVLRNGGSADTLKSHPWFNGMNWEALINKQISSPYKPKLPDLEKEIQMAMKSFSVLEDQINREEIVEDLHENDNRRPKNAPLAWDQDF